MYSFQKFLKVFDFTVFSKLWFWESRKLINPFQPSVAFWIETSCLICSASQMTGFYIKFNDELKRVNWMMSVIRKTNYSYIVTHMLPTHPFFTPWKHQKTLRFSVVFRVWRKGALGTIGLIGKFILVVICILVNWY